MNKSQMEMVSVKNAIERTIAGLVATYTKDLWSDPAQQVQQFFGEVERYVASLFVSRQITNDFSVTSSAMGINVRFVTPTGDHSAVNYMLPAVLMWSNTQKKQEPVQLDIDLTLPELPVGDVTYFETAEFPYIDPEVITSAQEQVRAMIESRQSEEQLAAYERAMKIID